MVAEELRAELAAARRADIEKGEQLAEAHSLMDSMSKELGILSSRWARGQGCCQLPAARLLLAAARGAPG
jgi:hypothetical protein